MTELSSKQIERAVSPVLKELIGKDQFKGMIPDVYVGSEGQDVVRIWIQTKGEPKSLLGRGLLSKLIDDVNSIFQKKGDHRLALISFGDPRMTNSDEGFDGLAAQ